MTDEILNYHRQVKKKLDCPKFMRNKFLADTKRMTDDFLAENPDATLEELKNAIGEPEELASMFLESVDGEVVARYRKKIILAKRVAVILLAVAFVTVTAFSIWAANYRHNAVITKESTIIIYETAEE